MGVKVTGQEQMMADIRARMNKITGPQAKQAINAGGQIVYKNIEGAMYSFRATGASQEETHFEVDTSRGKVRGDIYWTGPRNRYRIIHLNEKGYTRNGRFHSPRGRGAIARALAQSETAYFRTVRRELSR